MDNQVLYISGMQSGIGTVTTIELLDSRSPESQRTCLAREEKNLLPTKTQLFGSDGAEIASRRRMRHMTPRDDTGLNRSEIGLKQAEMLFDAFRNGKVPHGIIPVTGNDVNLTVNTFLAGLNRPEISRGAAFGDSRRPYVETPPLAVVGFSAFEEARPNEHRPHGRTQTDNWRQFIDHPPIYEDEHYSHAPPDEPLPRYNADLPRGHLRLSEPASGQLPRQPAESSNGREAMAPAVEGRAQSSTPERRRLPRPARGRGGDDGHQL